MKLKLDFCNLAAAHQILMKLNMKAIPLMIIIFITYWNERAHERWIDAMLKLNLSACIARMNEQNYGISVGSTANATATTAMTFKWNSFEFVRLYYLSHTKRYSKLSWTEFENRQSLFLEIGRHKSGAKKMNETFRFINQNAKSEHKSHANIFRITHRNGKRVWKCNSSIWSAISHPFTYSTANVSISNRSTVGCHFISIKFVWSTILPQQNHIYRL